MIIYKVFNIAHFRSAAAITQLTPLYFIKNGGSLEHILLSYSISFVALQIIEFMIIVFILNDTESGLILMLTWTVLIRSSFYNPCTEVQQGMMFVILQMSILKKLLVVEENKKIFLYICSGLTSYVILNFHVILILLAFFFHGFIFIEDKLKYKKEGLISLIFL